MQQQWQSHHQYAICEPLSSSTPSSSSIDFIVHMTMVVYDLQSPPPITQGSIPPPPHSPVRLTLLGCLELEVRVEEDLVRQVLIPQQTLQTRRHLTSAAHGIKHQVFIS
jgi:hypothetical protein